MRENFNGDACPTLWTELAPDPAVWRRACSVHPFRVPPAGTAHLRRRRAAAAAGSPGKRSSRSPVDPQAAGLRDGAPPSRQAVFALQEPRHSFALQRTMLEHIQAASSIWAMLLPSA